MNQDDIKIGQLRANQKDEVVNLNFYYTPRKLTNNPLVFNAELMNKWWKEGYEWAENKNCLSFRLVGNKLVV